MFLRVGLQAENNVLERMCYHFSGLKGIKMIALAPRNKQPNFSSRAISIMIFEGFFQILSPTLENGFLNQYRIKKLLHQGLSETEFYGDLVYKFETIMGRTDKNTILYKRIGCNFNVMRQSQRLTQLRLINMLPSLIAHRWVGRQIL